MKKVVGVLLVIALLVVGGCSNDGGGGYNGSGKIMGKIENIKTELGTILPVHVIVI